ncbi:hypothetical protein B6U80_02095 [Candidatus Pacearchaeota archaeon ex4484_26]|nr:MAG: hypothetical protein B6U80_02095 [Candidatus Pacearchaeota archaeon ex4484_26]
MKHRKKQKGKGQMRKIIISSLVILATVFFMASSILSYEQIEEISSQISRAVLWIKSNQQQKGNWQGSEDVSLSTAFCLQESAKLDSIDRNSLEEWLLSQKTLYGKNLSLKYLIVFSGLEEHKQESLSSMENSQKADGSWGSVGTTSMILYKLILENKDKEVIKKALNWLENKQNPDGGWAFIGFNESKFYPTSHATGVLIYAYNNGYYNNSLVIEKGMDFLLSKIYKNGKWISPQQGDYSATHKLCETVVLLINWDPTNDLVNFGISEIQNRQLLDGGWGSRPSHTAVCLWALKEYEKRIK